MTLKLISVFTGLMTGYLAGMMLGFTLFHPDQDMWALLGLVGALVGAGVGLTGFFRRRVALFLGTLTGFYLGTLLGILLLGDVRQDDLLEVLNNPNGAAWVSLVGALIGAGIGSRLKAETFGLPLFVFLLGGFLGGYVLGVRMHLAPFPSFVGWSPFVIGSGLGLAILVGALQQRLKVLHKETLK